MLKSKATHIALKMLVKWYS